MQSRNFSPHEMFLKLALNHQPIYRFQGKNQGDFRKWKEQAYPEVLATLGDYPTQVPLNPLLTAEWEHEGLIKQRWFIDVSEFISAILVINKPTNLQPGEKRPALFCCHGHGKYGKEPVMGNDSTADLRAEIQQNNYSYGSQMAKAGYITYAIDWIGFGERNDSQKPNWKNNDWGRDWCNLYYLHATMLGMTSLSINITHGKAATDFVCSLTEVDSEKLGVMGLSGGGTMTLWMALCDPRFKAAEIICYSDLWSFFGFRDQNYCGMQVAPGLFKLVDLPDLQGLLAPKPLLIDIGASDTCFKVDSALACFNRVKKIYQAAGAPEKLELDLHPNEHGWGGNKSIEFFKKYLHSKLGK